MSMVAYLAWHQLPLPRNTPLGHVSRTRPQAVYNSRGMDTSAGIYQNIAFELYGSGCEYIVSAPPPLKETFLEQGRVGVYCSKFQDGLASASL
jgi:hypothetical protein